MSPSHLLRPPITVPTEVEVGVTAEEKHVPAFTQDYISLQQEKADGRLFVISYSPAEVTTDGDAAGAHGFSKQP